MANVIRARGLRCGDAIGIVAPAGPVNCERMDRALQRLRERGFDVKTYGDIYRARAYLAGDDATRGDEFNAAFADNETTAVWCARGGYGVMRMLDRIDFDTIRQNPKVFVGFSDITALHLAIGQRTGLVTFHGPNVQDGFGKPDDMPRANEAALWQAVMVDESADTADGYAFDITGLEQTQLRAIRAGVARGQLTGGNLAVMCGLMGTPYEIETAGRILFLEDVSERAYRIDRYLMQLKAAGKLSAIAGVLLGSFSYDEGDSADSASDLAALFDEYLSPLGIPVLAGFPAGHEKFNFALPIGAMVEVNADRRQVTVLERTVA